MATLVSLCLSTTPLYALSQLPVLPLSLSPLPLHPSYLPPPFPPHTGTLTSASFSSSILLCSSTSWSKFPLMTCSLSRSVTTCCRPAAVPCRNTHQIMRQAPTPAFVQKSLYKVGKTKLENLCLQTRESHLRVTF